MIEPWSFGCEVVNKLPQIFRHFLLLPPSQDHTFIYIFPKLVNSFLLLFPSKTRLLPTVVKNILVYSASIFSLWLFHLLIYLVFLEYI